MSGTDIIKNMLRLVGCFFLMCWCSTACLAIESLNAPTLSLKDAILLAVRENPNVQNAQLNHVMQKFALYVEQWQFKPHFAIQAAYNYSSTTVNGVRTTNNARTLIPAVSWLTPIGTQLNISSYNAYAPYNPSLSVQIMQPLMQGFGRAIVEIALYNAMDSEKISRLNVESALRSTVTNVINAYLQVVLAEYSLKIDQKALQRSEKSLEQTKLFIKSGSKAGMELVTVEADVASAKANIENDKNNLLQARYALLSAIGINPNTEIKLTSVDVNALINKYSTPKLPEAKQLSLQNNIQYQVDNITLNGAMKRSLLQAEDNARWQLNFNLNAASGGAVGTRSAGIYNVFNGSNSNYVAGLNLTIPIDNQLLKQGILNAKIALRQAQIALRQEKWNIETNTINGWNNIYSALRAYRYAERAAELQNKTYQINFQKYAHGLIDSLNLQTAQQELISSQQRLINNRINYLMALVNVDQLIGRTLDTWGIGVRYAGEEDI